MSKCSSHFVRIPVEIWFALAMVTIAFGLSLALDLPLVLPSSQSTSFVGIHYLLPILGVIGWSIFAFFGQNRRRTWTFIIALPCYMLVLWAHFSIKLWAPLINPHLYDSAFWEVDRILRPLVYGMFNARMAMSYIFPIDSNFYMLAFIAMFYISFSYHAIFTPLIFRNLFLSALFFQGLGALAYLPFPALGPFLYEAGLDSQATYAQHQMLQTHGHIVEQGRTWLAAHGGRYFTAGLGAMPSLHSGGAFLFFTFAWRHARLLVPFYAVIVAFILTAAVATRWHYIIDLPFGLALGWLSVVLADRLCAVSEPEIQGLAARCPVSIAGPHPTETLA